MLTFGSLFAGVGGMDLGFERSGLVCDWQIEINPFCRKVLAKHWPHVRRHDDVRTFHPDREWQVDVICGGFPCKQTSVGAAISSNRKGLAGKDSGLWFEMLRVVRLVRPRWVVVENVAGAGSWAEEIEGGLEESGYQVPEGPVRLSAEDVGAPHLRRRLFWVAHRDQQGLQVSGSRGPSEIERQPRGAAHGNHWFETVSRVLRVDDGVPGGVDRRERITAIGNAVVPRMAELVGKMIVEMSEE